MNLDEVRVKINDINDQMLALFKERMELSKDVAAAKKEMNKAIYDAIHKFTDLKEGTDYDQITGNRYGWNLTSASADRSEFPVSLCHLLKRSKGHRLSHAKDALPVRNSKADCSFFVKCLSKREAWYHCAYQT